MIVISPSCYISVSGHIKLKANKVQAWDGTGRGEGLGGGVAAKITGAGGASTQSSGLAREHAAGKSQVLKAPPLGSGCVVGPGMTLQEQVSFI